MQYSFWWPLDTLFAHPLELDFVDRNCNPNNRFNRQRLRHGIFRRNYLMPWLPCGAKPSTSMALTM